MIGLDTNVLVRYLTHDDPAQYAKADAFINAATDRGEQFVVNTAVLCELVWVLGTAYGYSREEIARVLEQIFATAQFEIERLETTQGGTRSSQASDHRTYLRLRLGS